MVKLIVAYGPPEDPAAFDQHYAQAHAPLAQKIPNVRRFEAGKVLGTADWFYRSVLLHRGIVVRQS